MRDFDFLRIYVESKIDDKQNDYRYALNPGRDRAKVRRMEVGAGFTVPDELCDFYAFSYGANFGPYAILTISQIAAFVSECRKVYQDLWMDTILPFAFVTDTGDFAAFDLAEPGKGGLLILDCFHELPPAKWKGVCFGLRNWLVQMAKNDFDPFWL